MATKRDGHKEADVSAMEHFVRRIPVQFGVQVGCTTMTVNEVGSLIPGAVVRLDTKVGDAVVLHANGLPFAEGELVMVDDHYGVRVTSLVAKR
jgi:flagellar motor switch protein FliN/FliY